MPLKRKRIKSEHVNPTSNNTTGIFRLNTGVVDARRTGKVLSERIRKGVFKVTHSQKIVNREPGDYVKLKNPFEFVPPGWAKVEPVRVIERKNTGSILDRKEIPLKEIEFLDEKPRRGDFLLLKVENPVGHGKKTIEDLIGQVSSREHSLVYWKKTEVKGKQVFVRLAVPLEIKTQEAVCRRKVRIKTERKET